MRLARLAQNCNAGCPRVYPSAPSPRPHVQTSPSLLNPTPAHTPSCMPFASAPTPPPAARATNGFGTLSLVNRSLLLVAAEDSMIQTLPSFFRSTAYSSRAHSAEQHDIQSLSFPIRIGTLAKALL